MMSPNTETNQRSLSRRKLLLALPGLAAYFLAGVLVAAETKPSGPPPLRVGEALVAGKTDISFWLPTTSSPVRARMEP